jgi:hypothetical protein
MVLLAPRSGSEFAPDMVAGDRARVIMSSGVACALTSLAARPESWRLGGGRSLSSANRPVASPAAIAAATPAMEGTRS